MFFDPLQFCERKIKLPERIKFLKKRTDDLKYRMIYLKQEEKNKISARN